MADSPVRLDDMPDLMDVHEVAAVLRVGPAKVRELCHSRVIPSIQPGRALRIPRAAVSRYIQGADGE